MKVILYGSTGKAGSVILEELVARGHTVVAAARKPEKVQKLKNVTAVQDDLSNLVRITSIIKGADADAVVSAYGPPPDDTAQLISATDRLVKGVLEADGPRLIVVGGAGSLFVAPGITLRESGHLPAESIPIVDAHIQVLINLRQSSVDWTYFSPAAFFEPGERTGKFRLGKDDLITDAQGTAASPSRTTQSPSSMNSKSLPTTGSASPLVTKHCYLVSQFAEERDSGVRASALKCRILSCFRWRVRPWPSKIESWMSLGGSSPIHRSNGTNFNAEGVGRGGLSEASRERKPEWRAA